MIPIKDKIALDLPANGISSELCQLLRTNTRLVLTAPPGAGKSTLLPIIIGNALGGKVLMLEPRRLAARQIAQRMASIAGQKAGESIGYRMRFESCISSSTSIEVITEGILTRMLVSDPALEGVSAIIFDEFHERSLTSDTALALALESQQLLRDDLRIIIMSATIDASAICKALDAPLLKSEGRMFPVQILNSQADTTPFSAAEDVARAVLNAHRNHEGDILAFLPGEADIRRCAELLSNTLAPTTVYPLYGMLPPEEQRKAIAPSAPGERKVVLATPIAETSLTIEGVRIVVDSGLFRRMVFDAQSGLSHLQTERVSMDMATQRSGRAGRVAPGVCYRLWTKATESRMADCRIPEILSADLAPTVLEAAAWGEADASELPWLTPPPSSLLAQGKELLIALGALGTDGRLTPHGKAMHALPCHPRIAQMLLRAQGQEQKALACDIAALLEEKDPLGLPDADISLRINTLRRSRSSRGWARLEKISQQYRTVAHVQASDSPADAFEAGTLIAAAFPERVAKAEGSGVYRLASGDRAALELNDSLCACEYLAVSNVSTRESGLGRIFMAAPVDASALECKERDVVAWDSRKGAVLCQRERRLGVLVLDSRPLHDCPREKVVQIICDAAAKDGLSMFDFSDDVQNLQRRVATVAGWHPELELPSLATSDVLAHASDWLPLYLGKASTAAEMRKIDLCSALWGMLTYEQQNAVDRIAPSHIAVPTGSRIRVEYRLGADAPVVRVRLQECFGLTDTPLIDGKPVLMELLSPGFKPVQLTSDLRSFWNGTYFEVRKELRRRYPKHSWPDNPLEAVAVRGVKKH